MSRKLSVNSVELIKNFCSSLDTYYLSKLDLQVIKLFIKYSKKVMNGNKGHKNIAHLVLTFFKLFDDGISKPYKIKNYDWPFKDDIIDCSKLSKIPVVKYRTTITINNINLQLLKSCLQKYIRRNMSHKAIWCGLEWSLLRCATKAESKDIKSVITNLRNRLRIIYMEDIGIANIDLLKIINKEINILDYSKNPRGIDMDKVVVNIISNMSQSYHTRICSYVNSIYKIYNNKTFFNKQLEYLEYFPNIKNIYKHIEKNKNVSLKENLLNTLQEKNPVCFYYAQELNFRENEKGKYGKNNEVFPIIKKVINDKYKIELNICETWYNEIKNSEAFLAYFIPMLMICFPIKENGRLSDYFDYTPDWKKFVMYNIEEPAIIFDEYTMDMHTKEGNTKGLTKKNLQGITHFIKEGAYVNDEYTINNLGIELKKYYEFTKLLSVNVIDTEYLGGIIKKVEVETETETDDDDEILIVNKPKIKTVNDSILSEKDIFTYIARAQVPTSGHKLDSYYARMKDNYMNFKENEIVFVKGPFINDNVYDIIKLFIEMKKILDIPYVNIQKISLKISKDFFKDEIDIKNNVGKHYIRNNIDNDKVYTFIIYENLCGDINSTAKYGYLKTQKSMAWIKTNATIVNWSKITKCHHFEVEDLKNKKYMIEYLEELYFRYLFGIVDVANRNIIITNDILYGIDEENINMDEEVNFSKLTKQFNYINENWYKIEVEINFILNNWYNKIPQIKSILREDIFSKFLKRLITIKNNPKIFL